MGREQECEGVVSFGGSVVGGKSRLLSPSQISSSSSLVLFSQKVSHTTHTSLPVFLCVLLLSYLFSVFTGARMETN